MKKNGHPHKRSSHALTPGMCWDTNQRHSLMLNGSYLSSSADNPHDCEFDNWHILVTKLVNMTDQMQMLVRLEQGGQMIPQKEVHQLATSISRGALLLYQSFQDRRM